MTTPSLAVLAARHGLPGAVPRALPPEWRAQVGGLESARLAGLGRVLLGDRGVDPEDPGLAELAAAHRRLVLRDLALERELLGALAEWDLDPRSIRLLKGPAVARRDEADPANRSFLDVDVLVPATEIDRVVRRALATGSTRSYPEPRPGFDRRFAKGVNLVRPSGYSVDLHRTLAQGPFGLAIAPTDLFGGAEEVSLGVTTVSVLDGPRRWLHACYHAALGSSVPPLVALRDVVVTLPDDAGLAIALDLAARWRGQAVVAEAVRLAVRALDLDVRTDPRWVPVAAWVSAARPAAREQRWLDVYRRSRSTPLMTLYGAEAVRGIGPAIAYGAAVLAPRQVGRDPDAAARRRRALAAARSRMGGR